MIIFKGCESMKPTPLISQCTLAWRFPQLIVPIGYFQIANFAPSDLSPDLHLQFKVLNVVDISYLLVRCQSSSTCLGTRILQVKHLSSWSFSHDSGWRRIKIQQSCKTQLNPLSIRTRPRKPIHQSDAATKTSLTTSHQKHVLVYLRLIQIPSLTNPMFRLFSLFIVYSSDRMVWL